MPGCSSTVPGGRFLDHSNCRILQSASVDLALLTLHFGAQCHKYHKFHVCFQTKNGFVSKKKLYKLDKLLYKRLQRLQRLVTTVWPFGPLALDFPRSSPPAPWGPQSLRSWYSHDGKWRWPDRCREKTAVAVHGGCFYEMLASSLSDVTACTYYVLIFVGITTSHIKNHDTLFYTKSRYHFSELILNPRTNWKKDWTSVTKWKSLGNCFKKSTDIMCL